MKNEKKSRRIKDNKLKDITSNKPTDWMDNLPIDIKESYLKNGYGVFVKQKDGTISAEYIPPFPCNV